MITITLLALAAMQQPRARTLSAPQPSPMVPARADAPKTPYDSTVAGIVMVGNRVALVKSALGQLRRVAFNGPVNAVGERASQLRQRCRDLGDAARDADRMLCRSCLATSTQAAVESYRAGLSTLVALGQRCAIGLQPIERTNEIATSQRTLRIVRSVESQIVAGLGAYEARLAGVRAAFGWTSSRVAEPPRH